MVGLIKGTSAGISSLSVIHLVHIASFAVLTITPLKLTHPLAASPPTHTVDGVPASHISAVAPLPELSAAPLAEIQPVPVPAPAPPPAAPTAPTEPVQSAPSQCGDNQYANYIYMHESGCRTDAVNPNGACGIGQAYPCSKMGCSLSDYNCQNNYFTAYAMDRYGSWEAAYNYWTAHGNW